jgi:hypothetical protein
MVEIIAGIQAAAEKAAKEQAEADAEDGGGGAEAENDNGNEGGPDDNIEMGDLSEEDKERRRKGKGVANGESGYALEGVNGLPNGHSAENGGSVNGLPDAQPGDGVNGLGKKQKVGRGSSEGGGETVAALKTEVGGKEGRATLEVERAEREAEFQELVAKYPTFGEDVLRDMLVRPSDWYNFQA